MRSVDIAIIGAGSAGLSARREVAKVTDNYVVIDDGILGTTCARVGCMPSKVLIQVANDFHRRHALAQEGIHGGLGLQIHLAEVMAHVRSLRDRFVRAVMNDMKAWTDTHLIRERAHFIDMNTLQVGDERVSAKRIIIATGSSPIIPTSWRPYGHRLIDTNGFFELETLPKRIAVIGLGVIGLELGQALARLGLDVCGIASRHRYGGLTDPALQAYAHAHFSNEFPIIEGRVAEVAEHPDGLTLSLTNGQTVQCDAALLSMGRRPNLSGLGLDEIGIDLVNGLPAFDAQTLAIPDTPLYLTGDVNGTLPILHEASDEGRIAGYNAVRETEQAFKRRVPLSITFSAPNIAMVGESFEQLQARSADFVIGRASYEGQGRAIVKLKEKGALHLYADGHTGRVLGAEMMAPEGEHLAHLIAWAMAMDLSLRDMLSLPFYHPVVEEGLRTAIRNAHRKVTNNEIPLELLDADQRLPSRYGSPE